MLYSLLLSESPDITPLVAIRTTAEEKFARNTRDFASALPPALFLLVYVRALLFVLVCFFVAGGTRAAGICGRPAQSVRRVDSDQWRAGDDTLAAFYVDGGGREKRRRGAFRAENVPRVSRIQACQVGWGGDEWRLPAERRGRNFATTRVVAVWLAHHKRCGVRPCMEEALAGRGCNHSGTPCVAYASHASGVCSLNYHIHYALRASYLRNGSFSVFC